MPTNHMNEKLFKRLIADYEDSDSDYSLAQFLAEKVAEIDGIKAAVSLNCRDQEKEQQKLRNAIGRLNLQMNKIQSDCLHLSTTYHGDTGGGSDSYTICHHCKKELPKHWDG